MRILSVDGPYFLAQWRAMGHQVLGIGTSPGLDVRLDRPLSLFQLLELLDAKGFVPDAAVWADTCQPPSAAGFESLPWPTLGYSIDQYLNPWHVPFSAGFDQFLVAQRDYLPLFTAEHPRPARWMPLFCDPERDRDPATVRDVPMSFVGTVGSPANPARGSFLDAVGRLAPLAVASGDYAPVFGRSRIVLNQSAAGELNFRLFQAMACGAAVLTEDVDNGLGLLFTPGEHLVTYPRGNAVRAAALALAWLEDPRLGEMAAAGRRAVVERHAVRARAESIVAHLRVLIRKKAHMARLAEGAALRHRMATAYAVLATDEVLPLPADLRGLYLDFANKIRSA